jgi:hypothetical protein
MKKLVLLFSVIFLSYSLYAETGDSAASFLSLGVGANASGMGNAYSAVSDGAESLYWNPGAVVLNDSKKLSFTHTAYIESTSYDTLYFTNKINEDSAFGVGLQYLSYDSLDEIDPSGIKLGSYEPSDMALSAGYSIRLRGSNSILDGAGVGVSLKYIKAEVKDSATAFAADIGFITGLINNKFRGAVTVYNLGSKIKFDKEDENLPLMFRVGARYDINENFLTSIDLSLPRDADTYFSLGAAYKKSFDKNLLTIRAGYDGRNSDVEGFSGFNFGAGFEFSDISVDYAFVPYGDLDTTHRISVGFKF